MRQGVMLSVLGGALLPALMLAGPINALFGMALFGILAAIGSENLRNTVAGYLILSFSGLLIMYSPVLLEDLAPQVSTLFLGGMALFSAGSFGAMKILPVTGSTEVRDADESSSFVTPLKHLEEVA